MTQEQVNSKWDELSSALDNVKSLMMDIGESQEEEMDANIPSDPSIMNQVKSKYDSLQPFIDRWYNLIRSDSTVRNTRTNEVFRV